MITAAQKLQGKFKGGFTLIEIIIVLAILGTMVFLFATNYRHSIANQALRASAENFASDIRSVHIYAREVRDKKEGGIESTSDDVSYMVVSGITLDDREMVSKHKLEGDTKFSEDTIVWFAAGTGETDSSKSISLESPYGGKIIVDVLINGVVEVGSIE